MFVQIHTYIYRYIHIHIYINTVIAEDGIGGLMGRGLQTKIIANGMQGLMFSVLWKLIDERMFKKDDAKR
jgi:hypothetical protein